MLGNEKEQTSLNYTNLSLCLSDDEVVPNPISPSALWFQASHFVKASKKLEFGFQKVFTFAYHWKVVTFCVFIARLVFCSRRRPDFENGFQAYSWPWGFTAQKK